MNNVRVTKDKYFIGYNDTEPPENLPQGYLADALNCFCRSGSVEKRTGYSIIGDDLGSTAFQALKGVLFADGTKEMIGVRYGTVYKWTGTGNWAAISGSYTLNTSGLIDIVVANDNVYFFDGTNEVPKYNGTTMSTVAAIPIGSMARWFHNQLHVAGISGEPNALKSSCIGDPEDFSTSGTSDLDINPNDGDKIVALHELNNELIVFKLNRIWAITGFGTAALTVDDINERLTGFGGIGHFGIVNIGTDLLYPGFLGDRPVIRSLTQTRYGTVLDNGVVSQDIETTLNGLNKARLNQCYGIFDGIHAWFAFCNSPAIYNNLVVTYNTSGVRDKDGKRRRGWTRHAGINAACFDIFTISTTAQMYFGEASADSKAYVFDTSTSDNGTAINFSITTRRYDAGSDDIRKKFKWLTVWAQEVGDYDITIDKAGDGFSYDNLGTLNLSGTGSVFDNIILDTSKLGETDVKRQVFGIAKSRHRYIQFKMYDTSATSSVNIRRWNLYYQLKKGILQ